MISPELVQCGRQALAAVAREAANGAPLVKCQLLASEFFEALKQELAQPASTDTSEHAALMTSALQCLRTAQVAMSPAMMVAEFEQAVMILQPDPTPCRPFLRVIEGGRTDKPPRPRSGHLRPV